jgi:hypothetical protein
VGVAKPVRRPVRRADPAPPQGRDLLPHCRLTQRRQPRWACHIDQQRVLLGQGDTGFCCPTGDISEIVGEQPFQIRAHIHPPRPHHLDPRPVRVVLAGHDRHVRTAATAQHEFTDPQPQRFTQTHPRLGQQSEQEAVAQIAAPRPSLGVEDRAAVQDRLDLLGQQHRRAVRAAAATHPHQR